MTHNILEPGDGEGQEGGCEGLLGGGGVAEVPGVRSQGVSGASLHGAPAVAETVLGVVADVALHVEDEAAAEEGGGAAPEVGWGEEGLPELGGHEVAPGVEHVGRPRDLHTGVAGAALHSRACCRQPK